MANSYKDIIITPNRSNTADPKIEFRGANATVNTAITIQTYPTSNGTLSFEGSAGQLFSITNDLTGSIFSVNDVSGMPSIEVFANGQINLAEYGGRVVVGNTATFVANTFNATDITVAGNLTVSGTTTYINTTTLNVGDNIITLNADLPGATAPTENAGIDINRGSSANVQFIWDETNDRWSTVSQPLATGNVTIAGFANATGSIQGGSSLTIAGAASGITTLATGNTTITGFANVSGTIQGGSSLAIAGALSGVTTAAMGNTTITGFANVTSTIQGGSSLTIAGAASGITTLATGNTTITGFANVTGTIQGGGGLTIAGAFSGATSITTPNVTIKTGAQVGNFITSATSGNDLLYVRGGNYTHSISFYDSFPGTNAISYASLSGGYQNQSRLVLSGFNTANVNNLTATYGSDFVSVANGAFLANTTGAYPASNTVGNALGNTISRWALSATTGVFAGAVSGITTLAAGNTTISGSIYSGVTSIDPSSVNGVGIGNINETTTGFSAPGITFGSGAGQHGALVYGSNTMYFGSENGTDNTMNTRATLSSTGSFAATGDVRATIFYDSANTSYFLDPDNTGNALIVAGNVGIGNTSPAHKLSVNGTIRHTGTITNAAGVKTFSIRTAGQDNVNTTYELMRISRDPLNWSTNMPYDISVYSTYYSPGGVTRWLITYGYTDAPAITCYDARGATKHRVYFGTEVVVNANLSYIPVLVDIPNYYTVSIEVKYSTNEVSSITGASQVQFVGTHTTGTGALYSGDTHLVPNGGDVGIGTTANLNSDSKLKVYQSSGINTLELYAAGAGNTARMTIANDGNLVAIQETGGGGMDLMYNASGTLTSGLRLTHAGLVGIGTTSPNGVLTVFNAATFNARTSGINVHRPSSFGQYGSFAYDGAQVYLSSTYTGGGAGSYGEFIFQGYDSTSTPREYMRIISAGYVGIGTAAPQSKLQIFGSPAPLTGDPASVETILTLTREGSASVWREGASFALGRWQTGNGSNPSSRLDINLKSVTDNSSLPNVTVMTLQDNGNVGIGTTSPGRKLAISGDGITIDNGTSSAVVEMYSTTDYRLQATTDWQIFDVTNSASRFYITSTGLVGIGTTSPQLKFVVSNGGAAGLEIDPTALASAPLIQSYNRSGAAYTQLGYNALQHVWQTSGTERMRITSSGTVGIGTDTPRGTLSLGTSLGTATTQTLHFGYTSADFYGFRLNSTNTPGSTAAGTFSIQRGTTAAWINDFNINNNGHVGIGTTSQVRPLHVFYNSSVVGAYTLVLEGAVGGYGAGVSFQSQITGGAVAEMARITADGDSSWNTTASTQDASLRFYTTLDGTLAEKMRIDSAGNVGIGTTSPSGYGVKLAVIGSIASSADGATMLTMRSTGGVTSLGSYNATGSTLAFRTNASGAGEVGHMIINSIGDVGIGQTSPGTKLDVLGTGRFQASGDVQLYLNGNGTSWAGINFTDSSNNDNIYYNGGNSTFSIGGGGSNVANKKLHINGGATIGSGLSGTAIDANSLIIEGSLGFGSTIRQMINLWSTSYGFGVQNSTQYSRTGGRFSWFRGGVHSDTENDAGTGGTVAMTLDSSSNLIVSGSVRAPIFYDSGNTSFYVDPQGGSVLGGVISFAGGSSVNSNGDITARRDAGTTGVYYFAAGVDKYLYWDGGQYLFGGAGPTKSTQDFRAPVFYDSANTAFFVDPDSTSVLNLARANVIQRNGGNQAILLNNTSYTQMCDPEGVVKFWIGGAGGVGDTGNYFNNSNHYFRNTADGLQLQITGNAARKMTYNSSDGALSIQADSGGWAMGTYYFGSSGTNRGGFGAYGGADALNNFWIGTSYSSPAVEIYTDGRAIATGSFRAPIFYDTSNTAFYVDPSSTSSMNEILLQDTGAITFNDRGRDVNTVTLPNWKIRSVRWDFVSASNAGTGGNYAGVMSVVPWYGTTASTGDASYQLVFGSTAANGGGVPQMRIRKGIDTTWNSFYNIHHDGYADMYATSSFRAPIFYDSANTSFYLDPDSTGTSLNVAGAIVAAGNITAYSDIRVKDNIAVISYAVDKLAKISGITYTRTDLKDKERRYAGVIAQEIEAVLPEAVFGDENTKTVDYNATIALLIEAVKEQQLHINRLEQRINQLEDDK